MHKQACNKMFMQSADSHLQSFCHLVYSKWNDPTFSMPMGDKMVSTSAKYWCSQQSFNKIPLLKLEIAQKIWHSFLHREQQYLQTIGS